MEYLCDSANMRRVVYEPEFSHVATHFDDTPGLRELAIQAISGLDLKANSIGTDVDFGKIIGETDLVATSYSDEIVYAMRILREHQGFVPFVMPRVGEKSRAREPSSHVSVHLKKGEMTTAYELVSAWIGKYDSPAFPQMKSATEDSIPFWTTHAFVWGSQEIIPGSERRDYPW